MRGKEFIDEVRKTSQTYRHKSLSLSYLARMRKSGSLFYGTLCDFKKFHNSHNTHRIKM